MSPERWQRVEEVYHAALQRSPHERVALLSEICGDDKELRREVESLLSYDESRTGLVDRPAWEAAVELLDTQTANRLGNLAGRTISHYEILEKLGEGGMGVVYKARDSRLGRLVAIKALHPEMIGEPDSKVRFLHEAKAASALNHPNIVSVYEIDQAKNLDFIVMEYIAGKTLAEIIGRKRLPLDQVLDYAVQVADALAAAHSAGIVHRDLKPANVMVIETGLVKLLDFGIAKLTQSRQLSGPGGDLSMKTAEGAIIGTAGYMSPEQAQGQPVDARSDIFSFGTVLYEMVTGKQAFHGDTKMSTLAAVIEKSPKPIREIAANIPEPLERLILQCLRKQPARRFQHMDDVKVELQTLKDEWESGKLRPLAPRMSMPRRRTRILAVIAFSAMLFSAIWWSSFRPRPTRPAAVMPLRRLTWDSGLTVDPIISPDGTRLAYASDYNNDGNLDIWIQQVATGDRLRLTQNAADEYEPAFSPDGNRIAYRSEQDGGGIYMVSALGGEPKRIVREGRRPRFSPSGELIAFWSGGWSQITRVQGRLWVIASGGGEARQIRTDFTRASRPEWSPDGSHLFFQADRGSTYADVDVWVTNIDRESSPPIRTGLSEALERQHLGNDNWIFHQCVSRGSGGWYLIVSVQSGDAINIWRVPISDQTFKVTGPAEQLTFGTASAASPNFASSASGVLRMVFASIRPNMDIWSLPLDANRASVKGPIQRITTEESAEYWPSISEDGRKLVFESDRGGSDNIWVKDLASGNETALTTSFGINPVMSRDGRRIVYRKKPNGYRNEPNGANFQVYMIGEGDPELVCESCFTLMSISRDGEMLIDEVAPPSLRLVMTKRKETVSILKHPQWGVSAGRLSPDEHWIAFHTIPRIDARQVFVAPFHGPVSIDQKEWIPITDGHDMERYAAWSPDGNTLYFLSERDGFRCIRAQRLDPVSKHPIGPAFDIQHFHYARRSLMNITDPVYESFQVAVDKAVFAIEERTGNIWMTEIPR